MGTPMLPDPRGCDYAQAIVETMREPLLVLSPDLRVRRANRSFYSTFHIAPEQAEDRLLAEFGQGQWDNSTVRALLAAAFAEDRPPQSIEMTAEFEQLGLRTLLLKAQRLSRPSSSSAVRRRLAAKLSS